MRFVVRLVVLCGVCSPVLVASISAEIPVRVFAYPVSRDYVEIIEGGKAYQNAGPELQETLRVIARFATNHSGLTEEGLLALPGFQSKESKSNGSELVVKTVEGDDSRTAYYFDRRINNLYRVESRSKAGGTVDVWFTRDRKAIEQTLGLGTVRAAGSRTTWQVDFHKGINQPRMAYPFSKEQDAAASGGKVIGWDAAGNTVVDLPVPDVRSPIEVRELIPGQLTTEQLDALNVPPRSRMAASRGYRAADKSVQRAFLALAGEEELAIDLQPDGLLESLAGEKMETLEGAQSTVYKVLGKHHSSISVEFDRESGRLRRIEHEDHLGAYFTYQGRLRLFGGYFPMDVFQSATGYALAGVYPGRLSPRLAVLHVDRTSAQCVAGAQILVWHPDGELLADVPVDLGTSVEAALIGVQDKLTKGQKEKIGWQGVAAELKILLGTF